MELRLTDVAKEDISFFVKTGQFPIVKKIEKLLTAIQQDPFTGIGKPEPLKHEFSGKWSRRIDVKHRLVYEIEGGIIFIYSARGHYQK